jgi:N,N-dimethylformamidase beta subunit-like, C-terminal
VTLQPVVAYVSDEYFFALPDAELELTGPDTALTVRSTPSGAVRATLAPGSYDVVVTRTGYGTKRSQLTVGEGHAPLQIRLLRDERPLGYAWPRAIRAGEEAELRVHAAETYRAQLWRYGWERELVADLGLFADLHPAGALRQTLPDGDFTQTGTAWHAHHFVPSTVKGPERSGLYYVHVETESGAFTSFPVVVMPAAPRERIAVLASDLTWNAYNDFGGRSNYVAMERLGDTPSVNAHQETVWREAAGFRKWKVDAYAPLSPDRPEPLNETGRDDAITDPIEPTGTEHVAPAEWRLLGWLEREGFPYDYYPESALDEDDFPLDDYEVLILSTHPEYWTRAMYDRVYAWVFERGGKLLYLGGNGIDCEVELASGGVMTVLNGRYEDWTKSAENRFGASGRSTGALFGVVMTVDGMGTAAPYEVLDADHWLFEGTGLRNGDLFGFESLDVRNPGGASGHETDKLSRDAPPGTRILARGTNPDGGGGEIAYFETGSGGCVYSVGSISYVCSIVVDEQISAVTRNVLRRFLGSA